MMERVHRRDLPDQTGHVPRQDPQVIVPTPVPSVVDRDHHHQDLEDMVAEAEADMDLLDLQGIPVCRMTRYPHPRSSE